MVSAWNEYSVLKSVAIRRPEAAFVNAENIAKQWQDLNYHTAPNYDRAIAEFDQFHVALKSTGANVIALPGADELGLDSIYVRDSLIVTPAGIIKAAMGKHARKPEPQFNGDFLYKIGMTVIGEITAPGQIEGGDLVWLDEGNLLVGLGYRSNSAGVHQLQKILGTNITVHAFDLPHFKGPSDVFHLMSVLSPLDHNLAAVYPPLMPVRLVQFLTARKIGFIEIPDEEFDTMGCNILAIAPRCAIMVAGNPRSAERLTQAGCDITILEANEISRKGEGGPTCLTRPLLREA